MTLKLFLHVMCIAYYVSRLYATNDVKVKREDGGIQTWTIGPLSSETQRTLFVKVRQK